MIKRLLPVLLCALVTAPAATAAPVLVLGPGGHVAVREDRYLPAADLGTPAPTGARVARTARAARTGRVARIARAPAARPTRSSRPVARTVFGELARLWRAHLVPAAVYRADRAAYAHALAVERRLSGTRRAELTAVTEILHGIAASGQLTATRLPALFLTLARNVQWWSTGTVPASGERVEFAGSELVWEYYAGRGLQLQELGSFGKADGLYTGGPALYPRMKRLLAEIVPLATNRGGGLTWEYYFPFDGGVPPWTSAMSQGTALEALTRAAKAFADPGYLRVAHAALPILHAAPPLGVASPAPAGTRFLLYSFAPGATVINGFLQTLIGLYDYAKASGDPTAAALFAAGDAEARRELPAYDTGGWSLYQPGEPDTLDYHQLVTGFVQSLCDRTRADVYCQTADNFRADLTTPPQLALTTRRTRAGIDTVVRFTLDKPSHVGIAVTRAGTTVVAESADFSGGAESFDIGRLADRGPVTVELTAADLAGNVARISGELAVDPPAPN